MGSIASFDQVANLPSLTSFFSLNGLLDFSIGNFITINADFDFKKLGNEIIIVATDVNASLTLGSFSVAITNGTLALAIAVTCALMPSGKRNTG